MAIKPILFNAEMVRANLDGKKSCTRRIVKPQPTNEIQCPLGFCADGDKSEIGKFAFGSHASELSTGVKKHCVFRFALLAKHYFKVFNASNLYSDFNRHLHGDEFGCGGTGI